MAQDGNPRRVSLVFPIILITIGVLFLLHNWRPAFDPWSVLAEYWPLILVFVGLGISGLQALRDGVELGLRFG